MAIALHRIAHTMRRPISFLGVFSAVALLAMTGCRPQQPFYFAERGTMDHYKGVAQEIEYPDVEAASLDDVQYAKAPLTLDNPKPEQVWELSLEEAMKIALENSTVIRNLGGVSFGPNGAQGVPSALTSSPLAAPTIYLPALEESNPRSGVEAALSAFDAQFSSSVFWERNDTPQNVGPFITFFRPDVFEQDLGSFQSQIAKINATGGQAAIRHNVRYEWNNTPARSRLFPSEWDTNVEAEIRQPVLRGAGVQFNRIAGPGAVPGINNGIMIARLRVDESLADFEGAVRNLTRDVETAYWNLYYANRSLDSVIAGRDASLETWRIVHAKFRLQATGGGLQEESQARQQLYVFQVAVERAQANLYRNERHLRYMMGLSPSDSRLIVPSDEPTTAKVTFDWIDSHSESLVRSVELRRQKWRIKEAELGLIAAKNYLLPQLDGVARYRWLGLGDDLINPDRQAVDAFGHMNSAYSSMTSGRFQEWHLGFDLRFPFGFRREMSGVRYAQLLLTREKKVYQEQELELVHQLQDSFNELDLNYKVSQDQFDRLAAAEREVDAARSLYDAGKITLDLMLDAQRRLAEAQTDYYRAVVDYNLAITQVHLRKGSLLEYNGVYLAEGPWPAKAYFDAVRRARARDAARYVDYGFTQPKVISRGPYAQFSAASPGTEYGEVVEPGTAPSGAAQPEQLAPPKPEPLDMPEIPEPSAPQSPQMAPPKPVSSTSTGSRGYDLSALDLKGLGTVPSRGVAGTAGGIRAASYQDVPGVPAARPAPKATGWKPMEPAGAYQEPAAQPIATRPTNTTGWQTPRR